MKWRQKTEVTPLPPFHGFDFVKHTPRLRVGLHALAALGIGVSS